MCLELIPIRIGRIRIGIPWMPILIWIRQIDADTTRSGSTILLLWLFLLLNQWRYFDSLHVKSFPLPKYDEKLPSCEGRDPRGSVVFSEATNSFGIRPPPPPVKGQEHARQKLNLHTIVPDSPDPHFFGPPRSRSISQSYGSGSGSESGSLYQQAKIIRKTLIPTVLWLLLDFYFRKIMWMFLQK